MESILYCGTCTATLYSMPFAGFTQNEGLIWKLELSVSSRLLATSCWLRPTDLGLRAVDIQKQRGRGEQLLHVHVHRAGNLLDAAGDLLRDQVIGALVRADELDVDRGRRAEIQNLADHVGRLEKEFACREIAG